MLSKRLKAIADLVDDGIKVIDVGCDHALLDIYLTLNKQVQCIATDISSHVIKNAENNIKKYNLSDQITLIKTDGLNDIEVTDVDTVIMAGMGKQTILKILKGYQFNHLIIQSNRDLDLLRKEISDQGYTIINEEIVYERKKYYVIIKFKKGSADYDELDYLLGPIIRLKKRAIDQQYLEYIFNRYYIKKKKIKKDSQMTISSLSNIIKGKK
ncbi:MAG: class I SAM-dependent methyltransferase [Bacilli bacterium]|nr:class I SAM-dependent methyltransferase [Bacilli bacterium]MDD4808965.1 class I SAM-dependent methyltransferase [Bacilli bacterium]